VSRTADPARPCVGVDVTGADRLDLLVGDGGDGDGNDHGDRADARLTCAG
jgi:NPCBM/NEW2 domain